MNKSEKNLHNPSKIHHIAIHQHLYHIFPCSIKLLISVVSADESSITGFWNAHEVERLPVSSTIYVSHPFRPSRAGVSIAVPAKGHGYLLSFGSQEQNQTTHPREDEENERQFWVAVAVMMMMIRMVMVLIGR